jgi:hypothetical protein
MIRVTITVDLDDSYFLDPDKLDELSREIAWSAINESPNSRARVSYEQRKLTVKEFS